jgi:hypothetical protein
MAAQVHGDDPKVWRQYPNDTRSLPTFQRPAHAMNKDDERTFPNDLIPNAHASGLEELISSRLAGGASTKQNYTKDKPSEAGH